MFPVRVNVVTYNLWNTERWPARGPALARFLAHLRPDVFCVQELRPETRDFIDTRLPRHTRVDDPATGWHTESNIWWNTDLFELVGHGAVDIGHLEPDRRLFWVRLRADEVTFVVATTHLTWQGNDEERRTGVSPRRTQTARCIAALAELAPPGEPVVCCGDFNDPVTPMGYFRAAGYLASHAALAQGAEATQPAVPSQQPDGVATCQPLDWMFANATARPIATAVPKVYAEDLPPSDHWPIQTIYELAPRETPV